MNVVDGKEEPTTGDAGTEGVKKSALCEELNSGALASMSERARAALAGASPTALDELFAFEKKARMVRGARAPTPRPASAVLRPFLFPARFPSSACAAAVFSEPRPPLAPPPPLTDPAPDTTPHPAAPGRLATPLPHLCSLFALCVCCGRRATSRSSTRRSSR